MVSPSLRIFAVDISGLFSIYWESNQGKEDSRAFNATIRAVNAAREGFDRVAICCDSGLSWRRLVWEEYKANRPDRGAAYRHQLQRTIDQLENEACSVFRAPLLETKDGKEYHAEADDVLGTLCAWAVEGGHGVTVYSSDKDLLQLVASGVEVVNFHNERFGHAEVVQKFGIPPERIPDMLALAGDKTDNFKPYPRIGEKRAVDLIRACGSALAVFEAEHFDKLHAYIGKAAAATIRTGGREPAEKCLTIATVLRDLDINFDPLLGAPQRKPAQPKSVVDFSPISNEKTTEQKCEPGNNRASVVHRSPDAPHEPMAKYRLDPFSLEPTDPKQAWALAQTVYDSTLFKKFPTIEAVFMVILEGRALGIPSIIALKNANIVNGNVGWSARLIRGLAMKSHLCEYFRIIESAKDRAIAICKRVGDPEFRVESNMELAAQRGLIKTPDAREPAGNLWFSDPLVMHLADVERRGARMGWPEVVAGLYTPDELVNGVTTEGVRIIESVG